MNHTELRDFSSKTLTLISVLIDKRTRKIRQIEEFERTYEQRSELDNLIEFQTQCEYAKMLVLKEEKVMNQ